jgi:hypothetical protein
LEAFSKYKSKATLVSYIVLVIGIGAVYLGTQVGNSGGNIRHTEIRRYASNNQKKQMVPANVLKK